MSPMGGPAKTASGGRQRVLCYVRPWSADQFRIIAEAAFPDSDIVYCSDFLGLGDVRLSERVQELLRGPPIEPGALLGKEAAHDIARRCRLLRSLPHAEAMRRLGAMAQALLEVFSENQPEFVLAFTVDSYVLDLMRHLVEQQNGTFLGLVTVFINEHFRITGRGEHRVLQQPSDETVEALLDRILDSSYRPDYMVGSVHELSSQRMLLRRGLERWAKNIARLLFFKAKARISRDKYNFHYEGTIAVSKEWLQSFPPRRWSRDWRARMENARSRVFVPLQWTPEASIDYWCESLEALDYEAQLHSLVDEVGSDTLVVIKEHPAFWGYRRQAFYDRLMAKPNVVVVPPHVPAQALAQSATCIVSHSSSVAFEAALRGVPAIMLSRAYFVSGRLMHTVPDTHAAALLACEAAPQMAITREEQKEMIRRVLSSCLPGRLRDDGSFDVRRADHRAEAQAIGNSIKVALSERPATAS